MDNTSYIPSFSELFGMQFSQKDQDRMRKLVQEENTPKNGKIYTKEEMVVMPEDADTEEVKEYFNELNRGE